MLIARGHTHVGRADLRWAVVFTPGLWCVTVERDGLVLDTRFVPAATDSRRAPVGVYLRPLGSFTVHGAPPSGGARFEAPAAFVLSDEQLEGSGGTRPFTFAASASGRPFAAIQIPLRPADVTVAPSLMPVPLDLDAPTWEAAAAVARLSPSDDAFRRDVDALVARLAARGLVDAAAAARARQGPSKAFSLLWQGLRPMIERFYLTPTLQEVGDATGVSLRQVDRYVQEFVTSFALVGEGWRPATRHLRIKLAVLLLSAADASVGEIALAVGYRSSDAMARAFRDAGLSAPATVQRQVRAASGSTPPPAPTLPDA